MAVRRAPMSGVDETSRKSRWKSSRSPTARPPTLHVEPRYRAKPHPVPHGVDEDRVERIHDDADDPALISPPSTRLRAAQRDLSTTRLLLSIFCSCRMRGMIRLGAHPGPGGRTEHCRRTMVSTTPTSGPPQPCGHRLKPLPMTDQFRVAVDRSGVRAGRCRCWLDRS